MPYPPKDGGAIATWSMTRSFADLGHDITVLAMNTSKHYCDPHSIPAHHRERIRFIPVYTNTRIRPLNALANLVFSRKPYNAQRFVTAAFKSRLEELLRSETFDVIQLEGLYLAPYLPVIRKYSEALVSMRAHNIEHEIWQRTAAQCKGMKKRYLHDLAGRIRRMEYHFMNRFDAVVPITLRDLNKLRDMRCHIPAHVAPTGIFPDALKPDHSTRAYPSVFHIGALDWGPNQEGILWFVEKVWPEITMQFPNLKFYIAGRNAPRWIRSLSGKNIRFAGEVEDAYDFMRSGAIMVVPLLSGSGMRIKIIEGMALGKSIVTTSVGTEGIPTCNGKNIIIADTPQEFTAGIRLLLENFDTFEQMGQEATRFIRDRFNNEKISASLLKFYEENRYAVR